MAFTARFRRCRRAGGSTQTQKRGRLAANLEPRLAKWSAIARQAGSVERANELLVRATGVTDDLLGHWLQRLAGRQVVVILDACRSGGMATQEKGFAGKFDTSFDFLDGEFARLKDIGQPESALLAACGVRQNASAIRVPDRIMAQLRAGTKGAVDDWAPDATLSVLTYYFVEGLLTGERPLNLNQIHHHCQTGMATYFQEVNEIQENQGKERVAPHQPVLVKYSSAAIIVKP